MVWNTETYSILVCGIYKLTFNSISLDIFGTLAIIFPIKLFILTLGFSNPCRYRHGSDFWIYLSEMWMGPVNESILNCKSWKFGNKSSYINYNIHRSPLAAAEILATETSQLLWPTAITNCDGLRPWIASLWLHKCYGHWPQQTVAAEGRKWWRHIMGLIWPQNGQSGKPG